MPHHHDTRQPAVREGVGPMMLVVTWWALVLSPVNASAQEEEEAPSAVAAVSAGAPRTDIYLATLGGTGEYVLLGRPRNVTPRVGYDNQPAFSADGQALFYTSIRGDGQADIYRLSLHDEQAAPVRLTATATMSEYSPTPMPGGGLSTVRVEPDGAQHLWRLTGVGTDVTRLLPSLDNVGYHLWTSDTHLALFLVGEPLSLVLAERADRTPPGEASAPKPIAEGIGRALARSADGRYVVFVQSLDENNRELRRYEVATGEVSTWAPMVPGGAGDFAIDPTSGAAFTVLGRTLLRLPADQSRWLAVGDLIVPGGEVSRLAISPQGDRLAIVVAEAAAEGEG
ncbi:MAG: hypothetical protein AAF184_01120 [Pseudomonadota bacterium]